MDTAGLVKDLLGLYGPLAIGWLVALFLGWRVINEKDKPNEGVKAYQDILKTYQAICDDYHTAIVENSRVTERLALLIEERTRRALNGER